MAVTRSAKTTPQPKAKGPPPESPMTLHLSMFNDLMTLPMSRAFDAMLRPGS